MWTEISNDRVMFRDGDLVVIKPREAPAPVPLFCPVCDTMMRTDDDVRKWRELACCYQCGMKWADANREKWSGGWRPQIEDVFTEVERRKQMPISAKLEGI